MTNPYLDKAKRAVDDRIDRTPDETQALALIAIAVELQAIRRHLVRSDPEPEHVAEVPFYAIVDDVEPGIIVG